MPILMSLLVRPRLIVWLVLGGEKGLINYQPNLIWDKHQTTTNQQPAILDGIYQGKMVIFQLAMLVANLKWNYLP